MAPVFCRLVRFQDPSGQTYYGEAGTEWKKDLRGQTVPVYDIANPFEESFQLSGKHAKIEKILSPLPSVPIIVAIGLNYTVHAEEANLPIPIFPVVFTKYANTLAGPFDDIHYHPECTEMDYEGELCIVIGKDVKNFCSTDNPLDFVLGYTVGNDVSSRYWQEAKRAGAQHGYAKSFDQFSPVGPVIASSNFVLDPEKLELRTWVNGDLRQSASTSGLIFGISAILTHLSRGTTLREGTIIMTGTPNGVAAFLRPFNWLKSGDRVEIEIERIGKISNTMVEETSQA